ncbi:hypothetical protein [Lentilactobacillus laojiaonis]|uniref:hypothetical protein n=1 Tax=Lentilactobacillus laojiaonis TaxID=2883998 RepID=UPI001D0AB6E6|nr:hypothetical protein [Lentilactobacillus laojiaonis]UDM31687.1 hypothetical protein LHL71_03845 [Lentilactobacillus laojiaonis]
MLGILLFIFTIGLGVQATFLNKERIERDVVRTNISQRVVDEINQNYSHFNKLTITVTKPEIDSIFISQIDRVWSNQSINFNNSTTRNLIEQKIKNQFPAISPSSAAFSLLSERIINLTVTSLNQQVQNINANQDVQKFQSIKKTVKILTEVIGVILVVLIIYILFKKLLFYTLGHGMIISAFILLIVGLITYIFKNNITSPVPIIMQPLSVGLVSSFITYIILAGIIELVIGIVASFISSLFKK